MTEWFFSNWSESDAFQVGICVAAAVISSLLISNQRRRIFGAIFAGLGIAARTLGSGVAFAAKKLGSGAKRAMAGSRSAFRSANSRTTAQIEKAIHTRNQRWRDELRPGCQVSYVDGLPEEQVIVCRGRVAWIRNGDNALIDWDGTAAYPFTGELGPEHEARSTHDAELILKEHRVGDRGVTYDELDMLYLSPGWSILSWPTTPLPAWLRIATSIGNFTTTD